MSFRTKLGQN